MKPSEQLLYAGGHDGHFPFADEEKEAQRLSDLLKITVLLRSLSGSGAHALDLSDFSASVQQSTSSPMA